MTMVLNSGHADLVDQVKAVVGQTLNDQKDRVADRLSEVARAMHDTGRTLTQHNATAARYAQTWASRVEGVADSVKEKSASELVSQTEAFARRQPALFVGTAVAAGFLLARVLQGGAEPLVKRGAEEGNRQAVPGESLQHLTGQAL